MDSRSQVFGGTRRRLWQAVRRGFSRCCPRCGQGAIFRGFVQVNERCAICDLGLGGYRVDDAPPYFTILVVGHLVVPCMLLLERLRHPPDWVHIALWLPLTLVLAMVLLPKVKGALLGLHWANDIKS